MAERVAQWNGVSGRGYWYLVFPIDQVFQDEPGTYIFATETQQDQFRAEYIGETGNLGERLANHEKKDCAKRHGATQVHVHTAEGGEAVRKAEEADLIARNDPPCNNI